MEIDEKSQEEHSVEQKDENTVIPSTSILVDHSDNTNFANTMRDNHWYTDPDQLEYLNDCRLRGALPSGYFIRHLKDESLSLKYSVLGLKKLKPIFSSISNSLNITQLDLTNACLNDECVNHLCHMLRENTFITNLNLSENHLTSKSVEYLCETLNLSTELLQLNLRKNLFDDIAGKFFSELITTTRKLKYMNISYNDLGELSCQYIGRALPQATTLTEFDLSWNRLGRGKMNIFGKGLAVSSIYFAVKFSFVVISSRDQYSWMK
ncbi:unnamed protein product [Schistosoma margrebowiei]|uniref:Uncharacterized protein n=1 Tax=Schistosoma margrebowiei TaxID=48269 RepID=A0A183LNS4_9TREM|nr:unnamed protein product [Schistosoma margrebowiei]